MTTTESTARRRADNLARLLADERGAEVLAELQKLRLETSPRRPRPGRPATNDTIGAWRVVATGDGPELRRRDLDASELRAWADVEHVPAAAGAARVVLLGESSARGFLLDPEYTPALALQRVLDTSLADAQVVDLAHTGADVPDLLSVARRLPVLEPDVIVVYAGNNWARARHTPAHLDLLATAVREGGYPGLRRTYLDRIVAPGVDRVLDCLAEVAGKCRAEVVVVAPEFNLRGWRHDPELELPPLPPGGLLDWSRDCARAEAALADGDVATVLAATARMRDLDGGMSPVTGRLRAEAADLAGDPAMVRAALEESRDSVCGMLTAHTPRITTAIRDALLAGASARGFHRVDLAELLRDDPAAAYPDPELFLDYCHLSATGIDRLATAVADTVLPFLPAKPRTSVVSAGISAEHAAVGDVLAAVHNSYYRQPRATVDGYVGRAVKHPAGRAFAATLLRLLESAGPVWSAAATPDLLRSAPAARYLAPMLSRSAEQLGMWELRASLAAALGTDPGTALPNPARVDLLATAEQGLVDGAFGTVNRQPERAYLRSLGRASRFGFHLNQRCAARLSITSRVPAPADEDAEVCVLVNGHPVVRFAPKTAWTNTDWDVPCDVLRAGTNTLEVRWPRGGRDWAERVDADARALARGEYPTVLGVQGELFELLLTPESSGEAESLGESER